MGPRYSATPETVRELSMSSTPKDPTKMDKAPGKLDIVPDDYPSEWAEEDREIEDRKPDLGEIEEDTSEL
jgi:hypothetical protein